MATTEVATGRAGTIPAEHVAVGTYVCEGGYIGHITRVEPLQAVYPSAIEAVRTEFTNDVYGQPVLKFELRHGDQVHYFARFPHEPVTVLEV